MILPTNLRFDPTGGRSSIFNSSVTGTTGTGFVQLTSRHLYIIVRYAFTLMILQSVNTNDEV